MITPRQQQVKALSDELLGEEDSMDFEDMLEMIRRKRGTCESEEEEMIKRFRAMDTDGSGCVTLTELRQVLCDSAERLTTDEIDEIVREYRASGDGDDDDDDGDDVKINYVDFITDAYSVTS